jgi:hypothetical protein
MPMASRDATALNVNKFSHWTILVHRSAPAVAGAFGVNVAMRQRLPY